MARVRRGRVSGSLAFISVLALAACSSEPEPPAIGEGSQSASGESVMSSPAAPSTPLTPTDAVPATSTPADDALHLVVVGDSIPFAAFCPGCTGFVRQYAAELEARSGRPVEVANRSRNDSAGMLQITTQVTGDESLREELAAAEVVIVSVGYNNALPDASTWVACGGDMGSTIDSFIAWALATDPECLQAGIDSYAQDYDTIFETISDLRNGSPTVFVALGVYDGNLGHPELQTATASEETMAAMDQWIIDAYDRWNPMLCESATAHGYECVDLYHAFNGPEGSRPVGDLTVDGAHPSQSGNDLIAGLLADIDTSTVTG